MADPAPRNHAVWFDIPVSDLERAAQFYRAVLGLPLHREQSGGSAFYVLSAGGGAGGCLVVRPGDVTQAGVLVYLNVDGRIREALAQAQQRGGAVLEPVSALGAHGFRAVIRDTEGNRVALHSQRDA